LLLPLPLLLLLELERALTWSRLYASWSSGAMKWRFFVHQLLSMQVLTCALTMSGAMLPVSLTKN
jgi:hypothetical protein